MAEEDWFAAIDEADAKGQRNPYLLKGQYLLQVQHIELKKARDKTVYYLVELKILWSDNPDRPEGMTVTWMPKTSSDMGPINIKRFLAACYGIEPNSDQANSEITRDVAAMSVSPEQPCTGIQVQAQCDDTTTRDGNPFLVVNWIPVPQPV